MKAERDLPKLLSLMSPKLRGGEYVFRSVSRRELDELPAEPLMMFEEEEGYTVIVPRQMDQRETETPVWSMITLTVHSDLQAVGFIAAVTKALAAAQISVNVVSAFYHDHLFVPKGREKSALAVLESLAKGS